MNTTLKTALTAGALLLSLGGARSSILAQSARQPSPPGASAVEVGGHSDERGRYVEGRWIEVRYGRPIRRGRDLFGPQDFVEFLNDGAEVWRAGANYTTELETEIDLEISGTRVPAGVYTLFIELGREQWTLIVSRWPAQKVYDYENKDALFGAYYYTSDRDVVRATMEISELGHSFEQLSWQFLDLHRSGGKLALIWDRKLATVDFGYLVSSDAERLLAPVQ